MIKAYNFLGSWQLFPEKGTYESGVRPKSGLYKIEVTEQSGELSISHSWTSMENQGFAADYKVIADGRINEFADRDFAEQVQVNFIDSISFNLEFFRNGQVILHVEHEIQPNGYLRISQQGSDTKGTPFTNIEYYHKQMSVLPYAASVAGAIIKPTEEGVIRHKALTAMEEQTNMQLEQIRRQI